MSYIICMESVELICTGSSERKYISPGEIYHNLGGQADCPCTEGYYNIGFKSATKLNLIATGARFIHCLKCGTTFPANDILWVNSRWFREVGIKDELENYAIR